MCGCRAYGRGRVADEDRYREYWAYIRHAESLRFQLVGVLTAVGGAGVALVTATKVSVGPEKAFWILIGYGLLVGFAGLYLLAHKASYDRYAALMREQEPQRNRRRDGWLWDAFTWLLAMLVVLEAGVCVAAWLSGINDSLALGVAAFAVPVVFILSWIVGYSLVRRWYPDASAGWEKWCANRKRQTQGKEPDPVS